MKHLKGLIAISKREGRAISGMVHTVVASGEVRYFATLVSNAPGSVGLVVADLSTSRNPDEPRTFRTADSVLNVFRDLGVEVITFQLPPDSAEQ